MRKERAGELRRAALLSAQSATDTQAASMPTLYPAWAVGVAYGAEGEAKIVRHGGELYRCVQPHTAQEGWEPGQTTASLWARIDASHAGTAEDPIPAARGMEYIYGLYYADPEDGKAYLCRRDGEEEGGKIVLQFLPHELVGQYFEAVKE